MRLYNHSPCPLGVARADSERVMELSCNAGGMSVWTCNGSEVARVVKGGRTNDGPVQIASLDHGFGGVEASQMWTNSETVSPRMAKSSSSVSI